MTVSDEMISFIKNTRNIDNALDLLEKHSNDSNVENQILKSFENEIKKLNNKGFAEIKNNNYVTYFYQSKM